MDWHSKRIGVKDAHRGRPTNSRWLLFQTGSGKNTPSLWRPVFIFTLTGLLLLGMSYWIASLEGWPVITGNCSSLNVSSLHFEVSGGLYWQAFAGPFRIRKSGYGRFVLYNEDRIVGTLDHRLPEPKNLVGLGCHQEHLFTLEEAISPQDGGIGAYTLKDPKLGDLGLVFTVVSESASLFINSQEQKPISTSIHTLKKGKWDSMVYDPQGRSLTLLEVLFVARYVYLTEYRGTDSNVDLWLSFSWLAWVILGIIAFTTHCCHKRHQRGSNEETPLVAIGAQR